MGQWQRLHTVLLNESRHLGSSHPASHSSATSAGSPFRTDPECDEFLPPDPCPAAPARPLPARSRPTPASVRAAPLLPRIISASLLGVLLSARLWTACPHSRRWGSRRPRRRDHGPFRPRSSALGLAAAPGVAAASGPCFAPASAVVQASSARFEPGVRVAAPGPLHWPFLSAVAVPLCRYWRGFPTSFWSQVKGLPTGEGSERTRGGPLVCPLARLPLPRPEPQLRQGGACAVMQPQAQPSAPESALTSNLCAGGRISGRPAGPVAAPGLAGQERNPRPGPW